MEKLSIISDMSSYRVSVENMDHLLIPADFLVQAGLGEGVDLLATALTEGGFIVRTRQQILESLRRPGSEGVNEVVFGDLLRGKEAADRERHHALLNPTFPELTEEEQSEQDQAILAKLGF